ncbi:hypothetical protein BYT27DRAFT_7343448 [Phlegmacium glaucopus]|nr:hypothetical protein BYT27DRAFT_7343448 [Phlegmacium glaucopus]
MPHSDAPSKEAESSRRPQADPLRSERGEIGDHSPASLASPDAVIPPAQSGDVTVANNLHPVTLSINAMEYFQARKISCIRRSSAHLTSDICCTTHSSGALAGFYFAHLPTGQNLFAGQPAIIFFRPYRPCTACIFGTSPPPFYAENGIATFTRGNWRKR